MRITQKQLLLLTFNWTLPVIQLTIRKRLKWEAPLISQPRAALDHKLNGFGSGMYWNAGVCSVASPFVAVLLRYC